MYVCIPVCVHVRLARIFSNAENPGMPQQCPAPPAFGRKATGPQSQPLQALGRLQQGVCKDTQPDNAIGTLVSDNF